MRSRAYRLHLLGTAANHMLIYMASREAASRRVDTLDKVYSQLMLGRRATVDARKRK